MENNKVFVINPGSTSTKIALFEDEEMVFSKNISHDAEKLKEFAEIYDQFDYRKDMILDTLEEEGLSLEKTEVFSGRGGGLVNIIGGVYEVNDIMLEHTKKGMYVKHPANLGAHLAKYFSEQYGGMACIVNSPDTDEFHDLARVTGLKGMYRESKIHALNQKEIGIRYAKKLGKEYEDLNLVIVHLGGGISITSHQKGKMIDSNDIAQGDGPLAPTRSGQLPAVELTKLCFSGKHTEDEIYKLITKSGGLVNHLGTSDAREVINMIKEGNDYAKLIYDAMIYQIGKAVGAYSAVLHGNVDAIIFTGGIANDKYLVDKLSEMVNFLAAIEVMPGEFELEALAAGAYRVLKGEELKEYTGEPVWDGFDI